MLWYNISMIKVGNTLHTHIDTYVHPHGNRVDVVGMSHFADQSFYDRVQTFVDDRTLGGACVQYEGLTAPRPGEAFTDAAIEKAQLLGMAAETLGELVMSTGLVSQQRVMNYRPSWQNLDMSAPELMAKLDRAKLLDGAAAAIAASKAIGSLPQAQRRPAILGMLQQALIGKKTNSFTNSVMTEAIIDQRNEVALRGVDRQNRRRPGTDFVLIWGEEHLPGLGIGLSRRNFKMTNQVRVPAIRLY